MTAPPSMTDSHPGSFSVGEVMRGPPLGLEPTRTLTETCRILRDSGATEAIVSGSRDTEVALSDVLGIVTQSDLIAALAEDSCAGKRLITEVMQPEVHTIDIERTVDEALFELQRLRIHRLPVTSQGRLLGLLTVDGLLQAKSRELDRLRATNASLKSAATHDPLTRLANRRLFDEALPREIARSRRTGRRLGLLMVDIDHFKRINDTHGHQRGDVVLQELAARLLATVRRADLVARFGGEEFVVLASVPGKEALLTLADKLRQRVRSSPFRREPTTSLPPRSSRGPGFAKGGPLVVSISVGAALLTDAMSEDQDFIAAADAALYEAKAAGRDCVRFDQETSEQIPEEAQRPNAR